MKLSSFARSLACLAVASAIPAGAHARTCSLPGVHDFDVVVADSSLKEKVADAASRPGANIAFFQSLGSPLAASESINRPALGITLSYSALVDVDPIAWKLETLPGIQGVFTQQSLYCFPTNRIIAPSSRIEVYELLSKRWGSYYYLTTYEEYRQFKKQTGMPNDADWEWTGETFFADAVDSDLCVSGNQPVHKLEYRGPDGYVNYYYTVDADVCGYAKSDLGLVSRGHPFAGLAPRNDPVRPCAGLYSAPLYRLYNNRELQGRPNHRYTPSFSLASRLEAEGWTLEGVGLCLRP